MSRRLLLRLTRARDLSHRLTVRRPLVLRVSEQPAIARFLATGSATPRGMHSPQGRSIFRAAQMAYPPVAGIADAADAEFVAADVPPEIPFEDASSIAVDAVTPLLMDPPDFVQPESDAYAEPLFMEPGAPPQASMPPARSMSAPAPRPAARTALPAPQQRRASPAQPSVQAARTTSDRRAMLRAIAETATVPHRISPPAAAAELRTPVMPDFRGAQPQPVPAPSSTDSTPPDALRAPLGVQADDARESAVPSAAIPPALVTPEIAAVMPNATEGSAEAGPDLASPLTPAIAQRTATPSVGEVLPPAIPPAQAPAPLIQAPTTPDAVAHAPMPTPPTLPARQEPRPDAPLTPTTPSAPSLPDAATPTPQTPLVSPIVEVRAARRPLSFTPAPPTSLVSPPQPAPPVPAVPRALNSPADAAASPDQTAMHAAEPAAIDQAETRIADMPTRPAASPGTPATASDGTDVDDPALRMAALGRRLFGNAPRSMPSEPPAPPATTNAAPRAVPASEASTLPTRVLPTVPPATTSRTSEPGVYSAADLFLTSESDRSPQAWLARLTRAAAPAAAPQGPVPTGTAPVSPVGSPAAAAAVPRHQATPTFIPATARAATPVAPRPPAVPVAAARPVAATTRTPRPATPAPTPTPLPESVRRFLAPVVGIDPAEIPIYRGAQAETAAAAARADAITDGTQIALGAGNDVLESPQTLGLIAHELTHVARRRDPLFVPPILRPRPTGPQTPFSPAPAAPAPSSLPSSEGTTIDEEAVAEQVEARVTRAVREHEPFVEQPRAARSRPAGTATPQLTDRDMSSVQDVPILSPTTRDTWGDLPRPWEPLPAWLTDPDFDAVPAPPPAPAPGPASVAVPVAVMAAPAVATAPVIQRAGEERDGGGEAASEPAAVSAPSGERPPVEPDLDALSRQVYAILKRRLAAEQRSAR